MKFQQQGDNYIQKALSFSHQVWTEVPAAKLYMVTGEDISRFYKDHTNISQFESYFLTMPLKLPSCDFSALPTKNISHRGENNSMSTSENNEQKETKVPYSCFCRMEQCVALGDGVVDECRDSVGTSGHHEAQNESGEECKSESLGQTNSKLYLDSEKENLNTRQNCCFSNNDVFADISLGDEGFLRSRDVLPSSKDSSISSISDNTVKDEKPASLKQGSNSALKTHTWLAGVEVSRMICDCPGHLTLQQFSSDPPNTETMMNKHLLDFYMKHFLTILQEATRRRVYNLPRSNEAMVTEDMSTIAIGSPEVGKCGSPKVGILFSGGIDSMVLTAMADRYYDAFFIFPLQLLAVSFKLRF